MDRYIYDYNLFKGFIELPYCEPCDYEKCESIDFLDISDDDLISKVKSSFISAASMPNIIQYNRINDNKDKRHINSGLYDIDFQDVCHELISKGCLERDMRIDLEFLKERTKKRLHFPKIVNEGNVLHPFTFIHIQGAHPKLIHTKDLIADPGFYMNF